ncbi:MAG TPA: hypothetical protein VKF17_04295 [Isosphaeraceae bacterium]|nr:hypothetical protein [Isosphaeraceae bacterium]
MMSITITLTPDQEQKLEELARQSGKDPSVYVHDVVTAYLNGVAPKGLKTLEEFLAPIWDGATLCCGSLISHIITESTIGRPRKSWIRSHASKQSVS